MTACGVLLIYAVEKLVYAQV